MNSFLLICIVAVVGTAGAFADDKKDAKAAEGAKAAKEAKPKEHPTGYTDTPYLPGDKWRVHDDARPRPKVITPGDQVGAAPSDAIVLFDGTDLSAFIMDKDGSPADWTVKDGFMEVPPKGSGVGGYIKTKQEFTDIQLHVDSIHNVTHNLLSFFPRRLRNRIAAPARYAQVERDNLVFFSCHFVSSKLALA